MVTPIFPASTLVVIMAVKLTTASNFFILFPPYGADPPWIKISAFHFTEKGVFMNKWSHC